MTQVEDEQGAPIRDDDELSSAVFERTRLLEARMQRRRGRLLVALGLIAALAVLGYVGRELWKGGQQAAEAPAPATEVFYGSVIEPTAHVLAVPLIMWRETLEHDLTVQEEEVRREGIRPPFPKAVRDYLIQRAGLPEGDAQAP
jgi:hypothetical protein